MATTLATVIEALSRRLSSVERLDGSFWAPTLGEETEGSLNAADRDGHFLFDLAAESARVTRWTGLPGIGVWEQRVVANFYSEPTGDLLDAQVRAIDDARAVVREIEAFTSTGVEFSGVESVNVDVEGTSIVARVVVVLRYQVSA